MGFLDRFRKINDPSVVGAPENFEWSPNVDAKPNISTPDQDARFTGFSPAPSQERTESEKSELLLRLGELQRRCKNVSGNEQTLAGIRLMLSGKKPLDPGTIKLWELEIEDLENAHNVLKNVA